MRAFLLVGYAFAVVACDGRREVSYRSCEADALDGWWYY
jgi:hypothetical protein